MATVNVATESVTPLTETSGSTGTERARRVKAAIVGLDVAGVVVALTFASVLVLAIDGSLGWTALRTYLTVCLISAPVWLFGFVKNRLYSARFITRGVDESRRLVRGVFTGCVGLALASVAIQADVKRGWLFWAFVSALLLVGTERAVMRKVFDRWRSTGRMQRRVIIIGDNEEAHELRDLLERQPQLGYLPVAMVPSPLKGQLVATTGPAEESARLDAEISELLADAVAVGASSVLIAASSIDLTVSNTLIRALSEAGMHVELSSTLLDVAPERLTVRPLGGFPIVYLEPVRRGGWRAMAKRAFDILTASLLLLVTLPVVVVAGVAVKLTSPGPVFFQQVRVGKDGRRFVIYKLRTMVTGAETMLDELRDRNEAGGPLFKMRDDPRVTTVGRFLRKTSIDELPQLWNVIRGQMSMVGPRPALASEVDSWPSRLHGRLTVKPGLTGMWQVSSRGSGEFDDYVRLDLYYVDNWSLLTDLAIVVRTVPAVLAKRGAF